MTDEGSVAGKLVVASPALTDPNFNRTVVFIIRHDEEGAFGLVINRPLDEVFVQDHLPEWSTRAAHPPVVFRGGPVDPSVAFALGRFPENAVPPDESLLPGVAVVDLGAAESPPESLEALRIFSGYAGWGAGQLEGELKESAWFVVDARPFDLFSDDPDSLWRGVLKRQRGPLAMFAHFPANPSHN